MSDDARATGGDRRGATDDDARDATGGDDRGASGGDGRGASGGDRRGATDDDARNAAAGDAGPEVDPAVLRARVDVLSEENERLRREFVRARRTQYRRSALVLALFGLLALGGGVLFPAYREVLLALAGTGLFGATLTYYLTPERFVAASVAERVHAAHAATQHALIDDLGLRDERVYVPTPDAPHPARLFVPQRSNYEPPADPEHLFVVPETPVGRGVALVPTGGPLYDEFEATVAGEPADAPAALATQLADAVVETFELASAAATEPDLEGGRIVLTVTDPLYGDLGVPDHPIVSVVGTGLAVGLDVPVTATVEDVGSETRVVYEWRASA